MYMTKSLTDYWWMVVVRGVIAVLFGIALIAAPEKTLTFLVAVLGLYLLLDGGLNILLSLFSIKKNKDWWVLLVIGILTILVGYTVLNWPQATLQILFFLLGVWALFMGLMFIVMAIVMRKESYGGWMLAGIGGLSMIFGIVLFANPVGTITALCAIMGLFTFVSGIMTVAFGMELRSVKKDVDQVVKELEKGDA